MSLLDTIKTVVKNYIDSAILSDVVFGTVQSVSLTGVTVKLEQSTQTLDSAFILTPRHFLQHDETTYDPTLGTESKIYYRALLKPGDTIALIKKKGGQKYVVIGKV